MHACMHTYMLIYNVASRQAAVPEGAADAAARGVTEERASRVDYSRVEYITAQ